MRDRHKELLELLDNSGAGLYTLLTRLTLREDIAEELMQDLFLKLSKSRAFEKSTCRQAYARKAAINLAFDWRRKFRQKLDSQEYAYEVVTNDSSPLSKIIKSEELEDMLNTLEQLNENSRQIIVLRYIEQQSYEDIAQQIGKTSHQVRALCSKALQRMRDLMRTDNKNISAKEI